MSKIIAGTVLAAVVGGTALAGCGTNSAQYDTQCSDVVAPYITRNISDCDAGRPGVTYRQASIADLDDDDLAIVGRPIDDDYLGKPDKIKYGKTPKYKSKKSCKTTTTKVAGVKRTKTVCK